MKFFEQTNFYQRYDKKMSKKKNILKLQIEKEQLKIKSQCSYKKAFFTPSIYIYIYI